MTPTTPWRIAWSALRWLAVAAIWTLAALVLIFVVLDALPGDAASQRLGKDATPEALAALRAQYGLGDPLHLRLWDWLSGLLRGDLGRTLQSELPVADLLAGALSRTAILAGFALVGIVILGWGGAVLAGSRPGSWWDRLLSSTALAAICTPEFVVATALVLLLSSQLGWLPAVSLVPAGGTVLGSPQILVLPVLTMTIVGGAMLLRLVRPVIATQASSPHVEAARLAGLPAGQILLRHILPGAAGPAAQASAMLVPYLIGGTVVVERAFAYPGLGSVLVQAVTNREPELLLACALVVVAATVLAYRLADLQIQKDNAVETR